MVINPMNDEDARTWAMFVHLSALLTFVLPIPFTTVLAPLILWQMKKKEHSFVDDQGKEAVNFQLSILLYVIVSTVLILIVIGIVLLIAIAVFWFVMTIIAAVKAKNGEAFRYPLVIRFLR
ncbi:MAG: DUF4870 domain-containing protein [Hydrogenibacillus sp.]|nr:DUF4870 domain-containing protein [Hydrogenibacillus sp.]